MKRKKKTYSEMAKAIIQKYKRRLGEDFERFDPMAVDAMNRELEALMQRQEETRAKMLEADQVKMRCGGRLRKYARGGGLPQMYNGGITPFNPDWYLEDLPLTYNDPLANNRSLVGNFFNNPPALGAGVIPAEATTVGATRYPQTTTVRQPDKRNSWWTDIPTTAKISTLANVAGAVGSGLVGMFNRPEEMKYTSVAAPKYTPVSDEEAVRQAELAYQDAMRASRGLSPGRYYSQMGQLAAGRTGATAGIKERTANINAQGINQNAWRAAQLALQNEQGRLGAQQYNQLQRDQYIGNIASTIGNITGAIALGAKDVQAYDVQQQTLPYLSQANYQVRLKNGKLVNPMISRGGLSFYRDPKSGEMEYFDGYERLPNKAEYDRRLDKLLSTGSLSQSKPV